MEMPEPDAFVVHRHTPIHVTKINEPWYLIPFGDVHRHARNCDKVRWLEFIAWAAGKPRCLVLGMGDYDDMGSASERRAWARTKTELHEDFSNTVDAVVEEYALEMCEELKPLAPKMIGLLDGNHSFRFGDGCTFTQRMCTILRTHYLGINAFVRLPFVYGGKNGPGRVSAIDIFAHHGAGTAATSGGSVNRLEKMANVCDADIYLMGHNHHKHVVPRAKLKPVPSPRGGGVALRIRKQIFARTGSFLQAYVNGRSSYVVEKSMTPADLGVVKIELTPRREQVRESLSRKTGRKKTDEFWIDLHASL
jgi:hypothetical protein